MDTFKNVLGQFENSEVFPFFLKFFDFSTLQGAMNKKFQWNHLKTCLDTLRNFFGHFWNFKLFSFFFLIFPSFDPPGCTGHFFFREKTSKQVQNLFGHFWKRVWVSWILRNFCISLKFFDVSTLQGALAKKSGKNHIKTCLDNLGNVFGHFWKFEFFSISVELFPVSRVHWAEFFFRRNNHAKHDQTMFLGTFLENFESFEVFPLFCIFCEFRPPRVHWAKIFAKKITSKHVENMFDCFWERFFGQFEQMKFFPVFWSLSKFRPSRVHWARKNRKNYLEQVWTLFETFFGILKLWNLFDFCEFFLSLQGSLGTAFSFEKINQNILRQCFWERFRTFLKVSKFFFFLKFFPSLDPPGCTGDFFPKKNYLITGSENVWTILGTALDTLEILKFSIFSNLSLTWPSRVH